MWSLRTDSFGAGSDRTRSKCTYNMRVFITEADRGEKHKNNNKFHYALESPGELPRRLSTIISGTSETYYTMVALSISDAQLFNYSE